MISVCIAAYNGEKFIGEQINSILSQLGKEDEVIISDGGSTDQTLERVAAINDSRIQVVHCSKRSQDANPVFAKMDTIRYNFENALQQAKGDIIFLSDQDDIWKPNKVLTVLERLKTADCIVHDCEVFDGQHTLYPSFMDLLQPGKTLMGTFYKSPFMGCCMAFKKPILQKALPMPEMHIEFDTWIGLCAFKFGKVNICSDNLNLYRRHGGNASSCADQNTNSLKTKLLRRWYMIKAYISL